MIIKLNSTKALIEFSMRHEEDTYRVVCRDATGLHYLLVATDFVTDPNVYFIPNDLFIEYCCKHRALNVCNACALACDKDVRVWYGTEAMGCNTPILRFKEAAGNPFLIVGIRRYKDDSGERNIFAKRHVGVLNLANYTVRDIVARKIRGVWWLLEKGKQGFALTEEQSEKFKATIDLYDKIDKESVGVGYAAITYPEAPFLFLDVDWSEAINEIMAKNLDKDPEYLCAWIRQKLVNYINNIRPSTVKVANDFLSLYTQSKAFKNPFPCVIIKVYLNASSYKAYRKNKHSHEISFIDYLKSVAENWSNYEIATDLMDEYATLIH